MSKAMTALKSCSTRWMMSAREKRTVLRLKAAPNAVIAGNTINNTSDDAIDVEDSLNVKIGGNEIGLLGGAGNIGDDGIDVEDSDNAVISFNTIDNTTENGIEVQNSDNTDIIGNIITNAGLNGIYVNPSDDVRILDNIVQDSAEDGIQVQGGHDVRIRRNTVERSGDDGIQVRNNDRVRITDNTVDETGRHGIFVRNSHNEDETSVVVDENTVSNTDRIGIFVEKFTTARITDNTVSDTGRDGIKASEGDEVRIRRNDVSGAGRNGINVFDVGTVDVRRNTIVDSWTDGIHVENFGEAWIAYNDVENTGDDGIEAVDGGFVSIYDNYVELAGFYADNADEYGADGIHVRNVGDVDVIEPVLVLSEGEGEGFGESAYGADVEIFNNDVSITVDDGIEVIEGHVAYIGDNNIGHVGYNPLVVDLHEGHGSNDADGIRVVDTEISEITGNTISLVMDDGIRVKNGAYTGIFDNKVLLAGDEGIDVSGIDWETDHPSILLGAEGRGEYGWAVNIDGNEVAMTGDHGIRVRDSYATRIVDNDVLMAGMGEEQLKEVINTINTLASGSFVPFITADALVDIAGPDSFYWSWGDGDGIRVENVEGYGPNGWAVDIRRNDVRWTGGHGISVFESGRTRIQNNTVRQSGIDETEFPGYHSMLALLNDGPFSREDEGRRHLWGDEDLTDLLRDYIPAPLYIDHDAHDGIHVEDVYGGYRGEDYALRIARNDVRKTGDDGIDVDGAGRTLIKKNKVRDAGVGDEEDYGSGDEYGADGISVRNVYGYDSRLTGFNTSGTDGDGFYGYAVNIIDNDVRRTGDDGIEVTDSGSVYIAGNTVKKAGYLGGYAPYGADGIHVRDVYGEGFGPGIDTPDGFQEYAVVIKDNVVDQTGDDGIEVVYAGRTRIEGNTVTNVGLSHVDTLALYGERDIYGSDGIHVRSVWHEDYVDYDVVSDSEGYDVEIVGNTVDNSHDDGIQVLFSGDTLIDLNIVSNSGDDGISVIAGRGEREFRDHKSKFVTPVQVDVTGNTVTESGDDGIEVIGATQVLVDNNTVDESGDDGINVLGFAAFSFEEDISSEETAVSLVSTYETPEFEAVITNNTVSNSGTPEEDAVDGGPIGGDGIQLEGFDRALIDGNDVSNSVENGLFVSGFNNGNEIDTENPDNTKSIIVSNNTFTNNDIGAQFESGLIDLTGTGNNFIGGRIGMRFAPYEFGEPVSIPTVISFGDDEAFGGAPYQPTPSEGFAPLALVDDDAPGADVFGGNFPPTNFAGTIGAQFFSGQSEFFVQLANEAFFEDGVPLLLNGLDSTYVLSSGPLTPSDNGGILTLDQFNELESKFDHFPDFGDLGLFFFGFVPNVIDQEDIFNTPEGVDLQTTGLNVTLVDLPSIPGTPGAPGGLNNIAPAAGGEGEGEDTGGLTPEELNEIETAAGENEDVTCWGDALNVAGAGQAVNFSYGGGFEASLDGTAGCSAGF